VSVWGLPIFLRACVPIISHPSSRSVIFLSVLKPGLVRFFKKSIFLTGERKDHQRLEKLKAERQEKINELKEKTNYYSTQQLIQVGTRCMRMACLSSAIDDVSYESSFRFRADFGVEFHLAATDDAGCTSGVS